MQSDRPITKMEEDLFDRAPFARRVAEVIAKRVDPSSLVVGIYGPWGDGKTSVLAMIKESLARELDVILIDYNPWFYGDDTESITRSFFKSIGNALERSGFFSRDNIGDLLYRFGKIIPEFGENIAAVGDVMTTEALTTTRDRVNKILETHKKRVVVFIDDIDRLDRIDIQTLFKLIRLSGDFSHTTYVLAFDDSVVSEAIGEAYGSGDVVAGRGFLEKIIQIPLHLPPTSPEILRKTIFSSCDYVLKTNSIELNQRQSYELGNSLATIIHLQQRTPRQAKLYENSISFAVPILKGEVNVIDQMLIEAIRVFYPSLYKTIRGNDRLFLGGTERRQEKDKIDSILLSALNATDLSTDAQGQLKSSVLEKLFPRISNMAYGGEWDSIWTREKRLASKEYFNRYFTYAVPTGDISDLSINEFIDLAAEGEKRSLSDIIEVAVDRQSFELFITKVRQREDTIPLVAIPALVNEIAAKSDKIKFTREMLVGDWAFTQAAILLANLLKRLPGDKQEAAVAEALNACSSIPFATEVLSWCRAYQKNGEQRGFLPSEMQEPMVEALWTRLVEDSSRSSLFGLGERLSRTLFYCYRFGSEGLKERIRAHLSNLAVQSFTNSIGFIRMVTGVSWGMDSGLPSVSDFEADSYNSLKLLMDPEMIYIKLQERFGDEIMTDHYVHDNEELDGDVELRLSRQFAYFHGQHIAEPTDPPAQMSGEENSSA